MGKVRKSYTEKELKLLEEIPNMQRATEKNITYSPTFKVSAIQTYKEGQTPMEIFLRAGFSIEIIGQETPKKSLTRWRKVYATYSVAGLLEEQRGKGSTSRPRDGELSAEEKLKRAEARIRLLDAENELLKKLDALERQPSKTLTSS